MLSQTETRCPSGAPPTMTGERELRVRLCYAVGIGAAADEAGSQENHIADEKVSVCAVVSHSR